MTESSLMRANHPSFQCALANPGQTGRVFTRSRAFLFSICFLLTQLLGCATHEISPESLKENRLFPIGVYEQKILLKYPPPQDKSFSFKGIVSLKSDSIEVVGLSQLGTTVFRIQENLLDGKLTVEVFVDKLKAREVQIREYYQFVRAVLLAPKSGEVKGTLEVLEKDEQQRPKRMRVVKAQKELNIVSYDKDSVPEQFEFITPNVEVRVKNIGYNLKAM